MLTTSQSSARINGSHRPFAGELDQTRGDDLMRNLDNHVNMRITSGLRARAEAAAAERKWSLSTYVSHAIEQQLERDVATDWGTSAETLKPRTRGKKSNTNGVSSGTRAKEKRPRAA
jgi:hypothetical protein